MTLPHIPNGIMVMLSAMTPLLEQHASIPLGFILKMPKEAIIIWSMIGCMIPVFLILKFLGPVANFLSKHSKLFEKFFNKIFHDTHKKNAKRMETLGTWTIFFITALPIPGIGSWTASLIAWLFREPYWKGIFVIFTGMLIRCLMMTYFFQELSHIEYLQFLFK